MAQRGTAEVAYYDEAEDTLEKIPQTFEDFMYDNQNDGGILALFDEVVSKVSALKGDVESLGQQYTELKEKYDTFTNFNETMDGIYKGMQLIIEDIDKAVNNVITTAQQAVEEHMTEDETLMADLEQLNDMLGISNGEDWERSSASFVSGAGVASGNGAGNETGGTSTGNDAVSAVDDVISGKYGTGDERKEALRQAGYDPDQVQDLVNRKLKGEDISTYPSGSSKEIPATNGPEKAGTINDPGYDVNTTSNTATTTTTDTKPAATTTETTTTTTTTTSTDKKDTASGTSNLGPLPDPIGDGSSEEAKRTAEMLKSVE